LSWRPRSIRAAHDAAAVDELRLIRSRRADARRGKSGADLEIVGLRLRHAQRIDLVGSAG
jgi:hypothetical protein